jgi:hypothetical protein
MAHVSFGPQMDGNKKCRFECGGRTIAISTFIVNKCRRLRRAERLGYALVESRSTHAAENNKRPARHRLSTNEDADERSSFRMARLQKPPPRRAAVGLRAPLASCKPKVRFPFGNLAHVNYPLYLKENKTLNSRPYVGRQQELPQTAYFAAIDFNIMGAGYHNGILANSH